MVLQTDRSFVQVTLATAFQIQTHQIYHTVFGFFKLGPQEFCTKIPCNLHHAFRCVCLNSIELFAVDDVVLNTVLQRFFKKRPGVVQRHARG